MRSNNMPFLKTSMVGIAVMLNRMGVRSFSSVFSLPNLILPWYSSASCSIMGASMRQGPHQGAQQSMMTNGALLMNSSKVLSLTSVTPDNPFTPFSSF
jgi:hypothetical protein